MFLKDQRYMTTLAREGSFTRAAKCLGISQPALSKWLDRLEADLNLTLVIRTKKELIFTEAGHIYLNGCRECMETALATKNELDALSRNSSQSIILGGSPIRGAQAFAKVFTEFHQTYPSIDLQFTGEKNSHLKHMILDGSITMALLGSAGEEVPGIEYLKFMDEELLMLIPKDHPLFYDPESLPLNQPYPTLDLMQLADTPLLINKPETSYYETVLTLYRNAGLESNIVFQSNILPLLYEMVLNGVGAALLPEAYYNPSDGISAYTLSPRIFVQQGIGIRSGYPLSEAEEFFIHLLMNNWGAPYYMHQYADYYLNQRKMRFHSYEYNQL